MNILERNDGIEGFERLIAWYSEKPLLIIVIIGY
jgi:hypothetical protein